MGVVNWGLPSSALGFASPCGDVRLQGGSARDGAAPTRLTLKGALGPSAIHSMPGVQWRAANLPGSPPTDLHGENLPTLAHQ